MNTAVDIDEDGNSIATQREWTLRKNQVLGASIGPEFVEPGQSAQTISKRPVFKEMMQYVTDHPEVKYVIIYMRSRVFRNFIDAAITKRYLEERDVKLISAKEEFGEGYMGDAMEAITDVVNELQVRMSGEDIKVKLAHKVENGGSVGRAKLGYLNVREDFDGRLVNTIAVDPVRAPLIIWAFEQYATGEYSVAQLAAALEDQGLLTRASRKFRPKPLSANALGVILGDPYYTGVIRYKGKLYPGRHQPLISKELYLKVKEILASRHRKGDRDRVHFHYLKGLVYCETCRAQGRESRLVYSQSTGNGGTYEYFTCSAKLRGECPMPGIRAEELEDAVMRSIRTERIPEKDLELINRGITDVVEDLQATERQTRDALKTQLARLSDQEARLIDALADGDLPVPQLREKLQQITLQKGAIEERLARTNETLRHGAERAGAAIELVRDPGALYAALPETSRRELIQALFRRLYANVTDKDIDTRGDRTAGNDALHGLAARIHGDLANPPRTNEKIPGASAEDLDVENESLHSQVIGSNKTYLVAGAGLEPATSRL
ncbi:recombinase family protein [Microbacterium sp. ASV81]|uniref:recombinase family protein n=1 Tax=Microbacterium capsulatum TaxID=3041921 RepID=UPI0035A2A147